MECRTFQYLLTRDGAYGAMDADFRRLAFREVKVGPAVGDEVFEVVIDSCHVDGLAEMKWEKRKA